MHTVIQVVCKGSTSLRDAIISDTHIDQYRLFVVHAKRAHRSPGWAKIKSSKGEYGALNLTWSGPSRTLSCRVVTRNRNNPYNIVGDFIAFLLARHRKRIVTVIITQVT